MIPVGDRHLRRAIREFVDHYHRERPHQGLDSNLVGANETAGRVEGAVVCRERLGGTLKYYYREAA